MIRHSPPPLWPVGRSSQNFEVCASLGVNVRRFLAVASTKEESVRTNLKYRRHAASLSFSQRRKKTGVSDWNARAIALGSPLARLELVSGFLVHLQTSVRSGGHLRG